MPISELVESGGGVLVAIVIVAFVLWVLHYAFGSQVLGLPAMLGVFVMIAIGSAVSLGPLTIAVIVVGLLVLFVVIGMAMSLGPEKLPKARDEKPKDG